MDYSLFLGLSGMGVILVAFIFGQTGIWKHTDISYDVANLIGSLLLVMYAVSIESIPFLVLNLVWALFSLHYSIYQLLAQPHKKLNILKSKTSLENTKRS